MPELMPVVEGDRAPYVAYLEGLRDSRHRGPVAMPALRRAIGLQLSEAPMAWPYVYPWCGEEVHWWRDQCHLIVATLFAHHPLSWVHREGDQGPTNLGASVARLLVLGEHSEWTLAQFEMLLSADRPDVGNRLEGLVTSQFARHHVPVDWSELLRDLLQWWPSGRVAQRWARALYRRESMEEANAVDVH